MSVSDKPKTVAKVDRLVDEKGYVIDVPENSTLEAAPEIERAVGGTSTAGWWRYGLVALLVVAMILLALQILGGNTGTDVVPGTPTAAPQTTTSP